MSRKVIRCDSADAERAIRLDSGKLKNAKRTPQGFLRAPVYATRCGVFTYHLGDGTVRRELRHPDDVFAADSLATLAGIPVTNNHPNVKNPDHVLLDSDNAHEHMVGFTGELVEQKDIFVFATVTITEAKTIAAIENGQEEVSCGYYCDREHVAGVYEGEPYDVRQRNIEYNHLAIVPKGRAGPEVRLRLDAADAIQVENNFLEAKEMKIVLSGVEFEVTEELAAALKKELERSTLYVGVKLDSETKRAEQAEARVDGLTDELTKTKQLLEARTDAVDPQKIREAARARVNILKVAERLLPKETVANLDSLDDKQIMLEVIKVETKGINLDSKSDAYIEARFDMISEAAQANSSAGVGMGMHLHQSRLDSSESDVEAARKRQTEFYKNAWKTGTAN